MLKDESLHCRWYFFTIPAPNILVVIPMWRPSCYFFFRKAMVKYLCLKYRFSSIKIFVYLISFNLQKTSRLFFNWNYFFLSFIASFFNKSVIEKWNECFPYMIKIFKSFKILLSKTYKTYKFILIIFLWRQWLQYLFKQKPLACFFKITFLNIIPFQNQKTQNKNI